MIRFVIIQLWIVGKLVNSISKNGNGTFITTSMDEREKRCAQNEQDERGKGLYLDSKEEYHKTINIRYDIDESRQG